VVFPVVNITKEYFKRNYDLDLKVDALSLTGLRVFADQTMLTLVLNALVDNAGKYSVDSHKPVTISGALDADGMVSIVVANYGLPIDEDEQDKIFEKNQRGRRPKALNISGTGVGLHLARQIMKRQKGDLRLLQRAEPVKIAIILPVEL
jgi:signal transduction histidine kinase